MYDVFDMRMIVSAGQLEYTSQLIIESGKVSREERGGGLF
jgi:hypothetical protein